MPKNATVSKAQYEAAAERYAIAWANLRTARQRLELAEAEYDKADDALAAAEHYPGIPAYAADQL